MARLVAIAFHLPSLAVGEPDSWLRLTLIAQWVDQHEWYNHLISRITPGIGMVTPWTRPLDIMMLCFAMPFLPFVALKTALMIAAAIFAPALMLLSLWMLGRLYFHLRGEPLGLRTLLIVFLTAPLMLQYFAAGNADHHSLLATIDIAILFLLPRLPKTAFSMGALLGLGIWVSPEFLLPAAPLFAWLGLRWVWGREQGATLLKLCLAMTGLLLLGVVLEHRPSEWFTTDADTVSILQVKLGLWLSAASATLMLIEPKSAAWKPRFAAAIVIGVATIAVIAVFIPALVTGPLAAADPFMKAHFLPLITEMQPLWRHGIATTLGFGAIFTFAAGFAISRLRHEKWEEQHWLLLFLLLESSVFFVAILIYRRLIYYGMPPIALLFALALSDRLARYRWSDVQKGCCVIVIAFMPFAVQQVDRLLPYASSKMLMPDDHICDNELLSAMLQNRLVPVEMQKQPVTIYASRDLGPQILFFTPYSILTANYHRNVIGYRAHYEFGLVGDDEAARAILRSRKVNLLALCRSWGEEGTYFHRLFTQPLPGWMHEFETGRYHALKIFAVDP